MRGIDHFMVKYSRGDGPVKKESCESKCSKDCKCLGYFYHTDSSRCWIAYELKTMTRVANSTHLAYIKAPL
ncbi:EP1-like glycoprotein 3 [Linum grandiflorum]